MTKLEQLFIAIDNDHSLCQGLTSGRVLEKKIEYLLSKSGFKQRLYRTAESDIFISQPNGKYAAPDIIVIENDQVVKLEIKSTSKTNGIKKPFWNRNTPQENVIYIFGIKDIGVNYFLGQDILPPTFSKLLYGFFKDYLNVDVLYSEYLKERGIDSKKNLLGFTPIIAPQFAERKKNATDWEKSYFNEPWAGQRKNKVKEWIKTHRKA